MENMHTDFRVERVKTRSNRSVSLLAIGYDTGQSMVPVITG